MPVSATAKPYPDLVPGARFQCRADHHAAGRSKLESVSEQVHQDLAQTRGISDHFRRNRGRNLADERQTLLFGLNLKHPSGF